MVWNKIHTYHNCVRSQLYQLLIDERDNNLNDPETFVDYFDSLKENSSEKNDGNPKTMISFHALLVIEDSQTMRIKGYIK